MERRTFLAATGAAAAGGWTRLAPALAGSIDADPPPGFPSGVDLFRERFRNWSRGIVVDDLWTCRPSNGGELVRIVNWAARHGWRIRAWAIRTTGRRSSSIPRISTGTWCSST